MKDNIIFCFSGTGNCLDLAKNIASALGNTDIVMMRKEPIVTDVREAKRVGFVFPCYAGGLPAGVERYIRKIKVSPDAYTFAVTMCAAYPGNGVNIINQIIPLKYWIVVTHQCSCIWLFPHNVMMPFMGAKEAQSRSEFFAAKIAGDILHGVSNRRSPAKFSPFTLEHAAWPMLSRKKAEAMIANDKCIQCGQCAKICPTDNIRYIGKAVVFGDKCIQCLGCLQYCPTGAINVGKITENRERYHNANVSVEELTQDIISID